MQAITPSEVLGIQFIPDEVIAAINAFIVGAYKGKDEIIIKQDALVEHVAKHMSISRQQVFDNHWLDIEDIYRKAGWGVIYDKPAFNETYSAFFKFTIPKNAYQ